MRNAALVLGVIGGVMAIVLGFFSFGYTEAIDKYGEIEGLAEQVDRVGLIRTVSFLAPIFAIAGAAMAPSRALWGGILMVIAAVMMWYTFKFSVFTMFPIGMTGLAGVLALLAGRPDEPKSHF